MAKNHKHQDETHHEVDAFIEWLTSIKVVGVGGGGGNAVNHMVEVGLQGVEFIAMNTDSQVLAKSKAETKLQLGKTVCRGLGAGGNPDVGRSAAEENRQEIRDLLTGADMVFITAGMGGGTGTGAAPIVAEIARELGALTVAVTTFPFSFEGKRRAKTAQAGLENLKTSVDALILIRNDRLVDATGHNLPISEAYRLADDVLRHAVQGIVDVINNAGYINVDFADVRTVLQDAGTALMGIGKGTGEKGLMQAIEEALNSRLLEASIRGARGLLVNITSQEDLSIQQVDEAMNALYLMADVDESNVFYGHVFKPEMGDVVQVTIVATGFPQLETGKAVVLTQQQDPHPLQVPQQPPSPRLRSTPPTNPPRIHQRPPLNQPEPQNTQPDPETNLDIPSFLRRRNLPS